MEDIYTHIVNMPSGCKGHVNKNCDGSYSILINANLSYEEQCEVYAHEVWHIVNNDFDRANTNTIEYKAHNM